MSILIEATSLAQQELKRRSDADRYFNDPVAWAEYMLGVRLWSKQESLSRDLVNEHDIAVKAAHATGKSWWVALMIVWWVDTRYNRKNALGQTDLYVGSTAPSVKQIGAIVWDYVRKFKNAIAQRHQDGFIDHELPGYITADNEWKEDNGQTLGIGRKPPDNLADSAFQGIHRRYVLAIGDESVGLSLEMIDALGNITNNPDSRRVLICNPTNPSSAVGKIFQSGGSGVWKLHTISALDSPNFKPDKEGLPEEMLKDLVDQTYYDRKKAEYGEGSARFKARVLGEFAWDLSDVLITPEDFSIGIDTEIIPMSDSPVYLGVDVARFGRDLSVIYVNRGGQIRLHKSFDQNSLVELASEVHRAALDLGASEVRYDVQGVGQGFEELLMQLEPRPYKMIGLAGSAASPDRRQWYNARAFWWDNFRKNLRAGKYDLDPGDERLADELIMVEYRFAPSGGLLIESKDEMKKKGRKSPDFADAAVYSAADVEEMLNPEPKKQTMLESPDQALDDMPAYLSLLVQGWGTM